jgi:hypothetical protein
MPENDHQKETTPLVTNKLGSGKDRIGTSKVLLRSERYLSLSLFSAGTISVVPLLSHLIQSKIKNSHSGNVGQTAQKEFFPMS